MAQVTFRSCYARYRVWFPPERYGLMDTDEQERDSRGHLVIDPETRKPYRKQRAHPAAQFVGGVLALVEDNPSQAQTIKNLRRTISEGRSERRLADHELYEEDPALTDLVNFGDGAIIVSVPEELTDEDRVILFGTDKSPGLMTYFHNPLPDKAVTGAFDLLDRALTRYEVRGIVSPTKERAKKQLRPRIIDLVYALHDAGLPLELERGPRAGKTPEPSSPQETPEQPAAP